LTCFTKTSNPSKEMNGVEEKMELVLSETEIIDNTLI